MWQSNIMHRLKRLARRWNLHASIRSLSAARHSLCSWIGPLAGCIIRRGIDAEFI
jgi:hypothetical protein